MFKKILITASLLISGGILSATTAPPSPYGPTPTKHQLEWHKQEYFGLVCFGLNTYTGQEWGYGNQPTKLFDPSNLDTDQWARVSKKAGLKGLILVAKHHDGFCLWPSKTTKYTVAASPWKDGKGDVLKDLSISCKKYGLKFGVYISPWDRNHAEYGREKYVKDYQEQWREVLTGYGDIFEVWFDGANGGSGYYGGANERRSISKDYYRYDEVFNLIKSKQPQAVFFGGPDRDSVRWVGNESGVADKTNWCALTDSNTWNNKLRMTGQKDGTLWLPAEADTTILQPKKWYYNPNSAPRNLKNFTNLFYTSIGRNASLNLGLSIGPDGLIPERDVKALYAVKKHLDLVFKTDLARGASVSATNSRGTKYKASEVLNPDDQKYWATKNGVKSASLILSFDKPITFNRVLLQEHIALGQRIHKFTVEVKNDGKWTNVANETTIGYKRILRLESSKTRKVRLTFTTDAPCLTLNTVQLFKAPVVMDPPVIVSNKSGEVTIKKQLSISTFVRVNGGEFKKYTTALKLPNGGLIEAYNQEVTGEKKTAIISKLIGMAKDQWKVQSCSFPNIDSSSVKSLIDGNSRTMWHTHGVDGKVPGPHAVVINVGTSKNISGFTLMPRHDGCAIGLVDKYSFYVSTDGEKWTLASAGEFSNIKNNPIEQVIKFAKPIKGQFIKLVAEHAVDDNSCIAICELDLLVAPAL